MHLRGKEFEYDIVQADGRRRAFAAGARATIPFIGS